MAANSEDDIGSEEQRIQLRDIAEKIGFEWEQIAVYLGYSTAQIQKFKTDNTTTSNAIYNMLIKWVQSHPNDNYQDKMSWAFSKSNRMDLASQIKQGAVTQRSLQDTQPPALKDK